MQVFLQRRQVWAEMLACAVAQISKLRGLANNFRGVFWDRANCASCSRSFASLPGTKCMHSTSKHGPSAPDDAVSKLASHHFLVTIALQVQIGHAVRHDAPSKKRDFTALGTVEVANKFAVLLDEHMQHQMRSVDDGSTVSNDLCNFMTATFHDVAHTCLPSLRCKV